MAKSDPLFDALKPSLSASHLDAYLSALPKDTIGEWTLRVQDELIQPYELRFLKTSRAFKSAKSVLDLYWGRGTPFLSREEAFAPRAVTSVALSPDYLYRGSAKAKQILIDIRHALPEGAKFDLIRANLVVQHIRHHGIFLRGLRPFLKTSGTVFAGSAKDELLDFYPRVPTLKRFYEDLRDLQKSAGGNRVAAELIKKRASVFGYRIDRTEVVSVQTRSEKDRTRFFQMMCLHIAFLAKVFPSRFDRRTLFTDALTWHENDRAWGSIGLQFVIIRKKSESERSRRT